MDCNLQCQLCGKKFEISNCICNLGQHLLIHHPNEELTFFTSHEDITIHCPYLNKQTKGTKCYKRLPVRNSKNKNIEVQYLKQNKARRVCLKPPKEVIKKSFKTIIETRIEHPMDILCPTCKKVGHPELRKREIKMMDTALNTLFILTCWPICFFPFLMPQTSEVHEMFCKNCGSPLGDTKSIRECTYFSNLAN